MAPQRTANILLRKNRKLEHPNEVAAPSRNIGKILGTMILASVFVYAALAWEGIVPVSSFGLIDLQQIHVTGSEKTPEDAVIFQSGITQGMDLVGMDTKPAARKVEKLPWVARADITRNWLNRSLTIAVTEQKVVAVVDLGAYVYLNTDLEPFKLADLDSIDEYTLIRGLKPADFETKDQKENPKNKNNAKEEEKKKISENVTNAFDLIRLYREHPLSKRADLHEVILETTGFALLIGSIPTKVIVGDDDWQRKLDRLQEYWTDLFQRERKPLRINLNNRNHSEKISIRFQAPKPEDFGQEEMGR